MAGSSLLTLIDDIATILDDVSVMTKVAAKKTAGVLGDDLALNAQQVAGVKADRELPVVWAVAKGSFINKLILVPTALLISAFLPWAITPLLMLGGAFLCFEGFEKLAHKYLHGAEEETLSDPAVDMVALERDKIKGAVRTDFILSAEIIVITLGTVAGATLAKQISVLTGIAVIMTVGVYGLVAGIVKLDDGGLYLAKQRGKSVGAALSRGLGRVVLAGAPWLMRTLSVVGTAAMFMVGGGILAHGLPWLHHLAADVQSTVSAGAGHAVALLATITLDALTGIVAGGIIVLVVTMIQRLIRRK